VELNRVHASGPSMYSGVRFIQNHDSAVIAA